MLNVWQGWLWLFSQDWPGLILVSVANNEESQRSLITWVLISPLPLKIHVGQGACFVYLTSVIVNGDNNTCLLVLCWGGNELTFVLHLKQCAAGRDMNGCQLFLLVCVVDSGELNAPEGYATSISEQYPLLAVALHLFQRTPSCNTWSKVLSI